MNYISEEKQKIKMWYNIKNFKRRKRMIKSRESLEAVYIYIYIS